MFLKSLEMQGFKSFPDKTVLDFGVGITSVVGPNGSGKSNISDAVRWVLGEQSTKSLRGSKMEDVIFSGTGVRKAQGFAEVTLRLDNKDKSLKSDKEEVSVTRRYYRSGESEYILNGEVVRLKDVHEMFMDTGLGRDGYSIVSQGKVADMVSSKSNQRREMLEEAAGISHYRYRRSDAMRKLEQAEENMIRLRDILTELEGRVGPLKIQSEKAQKFLVLAEDRKQLEIGLWLHTIDKVRSNLREHEDKLSLASAQYESVEAELNAIVEEIEKLISDSQSVTVKIDDIRQGASSLEEQASQIDARIAVELNSIQHNNEVIERITREMEQEVESRQSLDDQITESMEAVAMLKAAEKQKREQLAKAAADIEGMDVESRRFIEKVAALSEEISAKSVEIGDYRVEISTAVSSAEEISSRVGAIDELVASRGEAVAALKTQKETAEKELSDCRERASEMSNAVSGYAMRENSRREKAEKQRAEIDALGLEIDTKLERAKMLDELEKNMEGYSGSVKDVIREVKRGTLRGIDGVISQLITVNERYSVAIETALGAAVQNIVTQTEGDAKRAINFLKETKGGRATFLPLTAIKDRQLDERGLDDCFGYIAIASELVSCESKYKNIVGSLLGRTVVAEDTDCAIAIAKKYQQRFKIVTLDGQVINAGGSMTGGSQIKSAGILSRANEIDRINAEAAKLKEALQKKQEEYKATLVDLSAAKAEMEAAKADLARTQEDIIRREGEVRLTDEKLGDANLALEELEAEKASAGERISAFNEAADAARAKATALGEEVAALRRQIEEINFSREQLTVDREELKRLESKAKLDILSNQKDVQARLEAVALLRHRMTSQGVRMEDFNKEIAEIANKNIEIKLAIADMEAQAQALRNRGKTSKEDIEKLINSRNELDARSAQLRARERTMSADRERLGGELARLEERKAVMENDLESTTNKLYDEYQLTRKEAEDLGFKIDEPAKAQRELQEIKNKIRALGNVNVAAIDEYKEVSERYEYMSAQIADIEKSREELLKLIGELTSKMAEQFREQFQKINVHFGETFSELFDGGKAELILENPLDVLECPIEIRVQPPGKNVQNIDLLSGGEKGLSAIALLFAILKVSPAPFCFFDEVEAALDEVNVTKYAKYARRMTKNTQFILITHRRGTMEEADVLYGVTMQEKGVSKLLELKTAEMAHKLGIA